MAQIYEAMFLMNPAVVPEWTDAEAEIRRLLERAEAKILGLKRWDDRKLAYEIGGHKRATYGLVFFEAAGDKISPLERDAQISEAILRVLVLRTEGMDQEKIDKVLASAAPPRQERYDGPRDRGPGEFGGDRGAPRRADRESGDQPAMEEPVGAAEV